MQQALRVKCLDGGITAVLTHGGGVFCPCPPGCLRYLRIVDCGAGVGVGIDAGTDRGSIGDNLAYHTEIERHDHELQFLNVAVITFDDEFGGDGIEIDSHLFAHLEIHDLGSDSTGNAFDIIAVGRIRKTPFHAGGGVDIAYADVQAVTPAGFDDMLREGT